MILRPWGLVALLSATATASYLCRVNVTVSGALLMQEFALSQVQMGRIFSSFLLGYALFQIPAGMLADCYGTRRVLLASAALWVILTALQTLAGTVLPGMQLAGALWWLLALRFLLGVSEASTFPAAARGISRWIPPALQGRANGIVIAAIALGSALAPPALSAAMVRWGWRAALLVSLIPALAVGLLWLWVPEPAPRAAPAGDALRPRSSGPGDGRALSSGSFILLTASYTLQGYVGYIFVFWFYLYLVQERHFDLLRGALMSSLPWILSIVSIPMGGIISDRLTAGRCGMTWGRRIIPVFGLTASGILLALGARAQNAYAAAVYLALATALVLCVEGPFWATMMEIAGARSGTGGGLMNMGSNIGGFVSPALTPVLAARFGWENSLLIAAGISILGGLFWLWIHPAAPEARAQAVEA
jgi:ACS family glucarate transporter-like MFS transporter